MIILLIVLILSGFLSLQIGFMIILDCSFLFFPTTEGKIIEKHIGSRNLSNIDTIMDNWYFLFVTYEYKVQEVTYTSSKLNLFNDVMRRNLSDVESLAKKELVTVYYFPYQPSISAIYPLKWNKLIPLTVFIVSSFIFIILSNSLL
ncbi:DUF3592 domain-containing protein [Moraxella bovis]|uniref:DUF3592 domain-containing protein n=1 Tax=Moraxella bovis TaxID=476 RepID=A0A378PPG5_MORBO|nr:DUF3592 domain-containing protein [Moraxella bovis]STY90069.1 Uncharacterised protein [Moraxella bovis]